MRHFLHHKLSAPDRPVNVALAGCGGTGSQVLTGLARLHKALTALGHEGLDVTVYDPDTVSAANIGRQLFSPSDIGQYKAIILTTRVNQFMGLDWKAVPACYEKGNAWPDLLITAVDSAKARIDIARRLARQHFGYWMDIGNTRNTGQAIIGTVGKGVKQPKADDVTEKLPVVTELYDLKKIMEEDQGPSCSLAAALESQDLMINQMVASCALQLLWAGFRQGFLTNHGCFIDLTSMRVNPLPVDPKVWKRLKEKPV